MDYREQIKYALKLSNRTAKEVAATCNLPETTIYTAVKKRSAFISPKNLTKIANELDIFEFYFKNYSIDAPTAQFEICSRINGLCKTKSIDHIEGIISSDVLAEYDSCIQQGKFISLSCSMIAYYAVVCNCTWQYLYYGTDTPTPVDMKYYQNMRTMILNNLKALTYDYRKHDSGYNELNNAVQARKIVIDTDNLTNEDLQLVMQLVETLRKKNMQCNNK